MTEGWRLMVGNQLSRRFIAGATCPACRLVDTIFVLKGEKPETMYCADCGHREEKAQAVDSELVGQWQPLRLPEP